MQMMNRHKIKNFFSSCISLLLAAELILILFSWIISSIFPESNVHSLLGSEGIRWLLGHYTDNLCNTPLVYLLLISIAYGMYKRSGIQQCINKCFVGTKLSYRERISLIIIVIEIILAIVVIILLSCIPNAILLSVSGDLFPSSFSQSIVPMLSMFLLLIGTTSGIILSKIQSVNEWVAAMTDGLRAGAPIILLYLFFMQFAYTIQFVFFQ